MNIVEMAMRRIVCGLVLSILMVSCSNYDLLIKRAIPGYMKQGARVISYCDPATEENHFLIYQYGDALCVNFFEKDRAIVPLLRASDEFVLYDYAPKIDNDSYQFVLDSTVVGRKPLSEILGCSLKEADYTRTKNPYEFLISSYGGTYLFDLQHPERLIHFVAQGVWLEDDTIKCRMSGDFRDYVWEEPVQYINYYLEPQTFEVVGTFDLSGNVLSFNDLSYRGISLKDPLFIDDRLLAMRSEIDMHYESSKTQEERSRYDRLLAKAREEAIPVKTIMDAFSGAETENDYTDSFFAFYCRFSSIEESDRPDYKYRLKYQHSIPTTLYLYTNDEEFLSVEYPAELNVFGHFYERRILDQTLWVVDSDLLFDQGIFAGHH